MQCKCGEILSNTGVPNDVQLWVYTDKEWDRLTTPETIETWAIQEPDRDVWMCVKCERIHVFEKGHNEAVRVYKPEE